jgi:DNA-binding CsgD family transcriptional regulator/tetratricopeptide (TPR) repeat protein
VGTRVSSPVLIGRQPERERLRGILSRAAAGETLMVTVGGDPGVGKTRLVRDMAAAAAALGFRVLAGACLDIGDGTLPFGPVVEALRPLTAEAGEQRRAGTIAASPALPALFPGLGPVPGGSGPAGEGQVFELLRELLDRLAGRQPVLLVVEDAHWADASTRRVLLYLTRNLGPRVCVVVTYRAEELHERYPLRLLLSELHRSSRCERIMLDPLTRAELGELIAAILGGPAAPAVVSEIMERAEGNPFYAEELLAVRDRAAGLPGGLRTVLLARIERLSREARPVLGAVAAGTRVPHDLLAAVTGLGEDRLNELLLAAVQQHVLTADADGESYAFRHALVREAVYGDMLPGERRQMHARIATVLAGRARAAPAAPASDLGELAYHWYRAGDRPRALLAAVRAGMAAQAAAAPGSAGQHYERALELWDEAPEAAADCPLDRAGLLRRAAETAHLSGDYARGAALAGEALAGLDAEAEPGRASTLLEFLGYCRIAGGDNDAAATAYSAAAACAAPASPERARALAGMSLVQSMQGRYRDAIGTADEGRQIAVRAAARATEARALTVLGSSLCGLGRLTEGLSHLGRAQFLAGAEHDIPTLLWTSGQRAAGLLAAGRAAEAAGTAAEIMRLARGLGAEAAYAPYCATPGIEAMILLGDWPAAGQLIDRLLGLEPPPGTAAFTRLACGLLRLWQGDADSARTVITRALQDCRPAMVPEAASGGYARLAEVATAQLRFGEARQLVRTGLAECAGSDAPAHVIRLAAAGVHAEAERGQAAASRRRRDELSSAVTTARELIGLARRAAAVMGGELAVPGAELAAAEADWARLAGREEQGEVSRWRESVRRWDALCFRYPAAHARLHLGHALLATSGSSAEAGGELRAALDAADSLGAGALARQIRRLAARARVAVEPGPAAAPATGPPGTVTPGARSGLTGRERQVLELLAAGLTNKNIARTLFISEKTVSVHVTHILAKLQVTNRSEAGALAREADRPFPARVRDGGGEALADLG